MNTPVEENVVTDQIAEETNNFELVVVSSKPTKSCSLCIWPNGKTYCTINKSKLKKDAFETYSCDKFTNK